MKSNRRKFIKNLGITAAGVATAPALLSCKTEIKEASQIETSVVTKEFEELKKYSAKAKKLTLNRRCGRRCWSLFPWLPL